MPDKALGLTFNVPDEEPDEEALARRSVTVDDEQGAFRDAADGAADWHENLALKLPETQRKALGAGLLQEVDDAAASQEGWIKLAAKGLKEMGIDRSRPETRAQPVPGASASVFPLLAEASVNFASRAMLELCPPDGPCDAVVVGALEEDEAEQDRAQRVKDFANVQLLEIIEEWQDETDKLLAMLPIEGSSYKKIWYDGTLDRIRVAYLPTERVIMPYHGGGVGVSPLVAEVIECHRYEAEAYIESGLWMAHDIVENRPGAMDSSELGEARDKVIGETESVSDNPQTDTYRYYEVQVRREIVGLDEGSLEWLVTIADGSGEVVAIRRNWRETNAIKRRKRTLVEYRMFPWQGARGVGLFHMIGGLNSAATSALRALFDAAMRASFPGGWVMKGAMRQRGTVQRGYGEYKELETSPSIQDIRAALMEDQFAGPHPVLYTLLEFLANAGAKFASVALQELGNATSTTPVGTTLARVEEGSKPFAAIFQRLHRSQAAEFQEIYEINCETITDEWLAAHFDSPDVSAADFSRGISVVPISDPRSFSQLQRTLRGELMVNLGERAAAAGVQADLRVIFREAWEAASLPLADEVFPAEPEPFNDLDPFVENAVTSRGTPLAVSGQEVHELHIAVHLALLAIPSAAQSPSGQALAQHILEHAAMAARMTRDAMAAVQSYGETLDIMARLIEPPDQDGIRAIAEAEMAKVQAKLVEIEGRKELDRERMGLERDKIAFQAMKDIEIEREKHRMALIEMREEYALERDKMAKELRETREKIASQERIAAANIASDQAKPKPTPSQPQKDDA